ncbi:MAG TPA: flagellar hook-associated protein FlgL [Candidatus Kurthia intestinigallinarum]|nr:flagellar hook-associated protein FlgL [Candidatus Kurthia intestinigallinarum]
MRVTQSMLSSTMLRNLSNSYNKMGQWQEQLSTGSKLLRPSDDPVGVTRAMGYRTQLAQNAQYDTNLDTASKWLDTTDTALGSLGSAMTRVQELITQAANDTNQTVDREKMLLEIKQIREEVYDIANTKIGDEYIFSGTRTSEPLYTKDAAGNSIVNPKATNAAPNTSGFESSFNVEIYNDITLDVNTTGAINMFDKLDIVFDKIEAALAGTNGVTSGTDIGSILGGTNSPTDKAFETIQGSIDLLLNKRAEAGAKQNRVDMMSDRLAIQKEVLTKQQSNVEDVEYEEAITNMITQESIHRAALSVGGRIIQQTLVDFIR